MQYLYLAQLIFLIIAPLVFFILRVIGIGFVTYVGSNLIIDQALSYVLSRAGNLTVPLQQIMGLGQVDVAINIFFAAITTRMVLAGINKAQDTRRAQVWKKPSAQTTFEP